MDRRRFIRSITDRVWDEHARPTAKAHLGRAREIRRDRARAPWWN